jgi:hypothetical protein
MSLTHYYFNDSASPVDRFFDDMFSNRAYRQGQHMDVFRPRWAFLFKPSVPFGLEDLTIVTYT